MVDKTPWYARPKWGTPKSTEKNVVNFQYLNSANLPDSSMLRITSYMSLQVRGRETQYIIPNKVSTSWSMRPWGGFGRSFKFQCFLSCSHKEWMVHSYGDRFLVSTIQCFQPAMPFFVSPTFLVNKKSPAYLHTNFNQFHPWNPWKCRSNMVRFLGCDFRHAPPWNMPSPHVSGTTEFTNTGSGGKVRKDLTEVQSEKIQGSWKVKGPETLVNITKLNTQLLF